jgi:hypothetical protein
MCKLILYISAKDVKDYLRLTPQELLKFLVCSCGSQLFIFWGSYLRKLLPAGELLPIQRVRCKQCKRTHALLPAFLLGSVRHPALTIHYYFQQWIDSPLPVSGLWIKAGEVMEAPRSLSTLYSWINRFRHRCEQLLGPLKEALLALTPQLQLEGLQENILHLSSFTNERRYVLSKTTVRLCWYSAQALLAESHRLLHSEITLSPTTFLNYFCFQKTGNPLLAPLARPPNTFPT